MCDIISNMSDCSVLWKSHYSPELFEYFVLCHKFYIKRVADPLSYIIYIISIILSPSLLHVIYMPLFLSYTFIPFHIPLSGYLRIFDVLCVLYAPTGKYYSFSVSFTHYMQVSFYLHVFMYYMLYTLYVLEANASFFLCV